MSSSLKPLRISAASPQFFLPLAALKAAILRARSSPSRASAAAARATAALPCPICMPRTSFARESAAPPPRMPPARPSARSETVCGPNGTDAGEAGVATSGSAGVRPARSSTGGTFSDGGGRVERPAEERLDRHPRGLMRERAEPPRRAALLVLAHGRVHVHALEPCLLLGGASGAALPLVAGIDPEPPTLHRPDAELVGSERRPGLGRQGHVGHEVRPCRPLGHVAARGPRAVVGLGLVARRAGGDEVRLRRLLGLFLAPAHLLFMMARAREPETPTSGRPRI